MGFSKSPSMILGSSTEPLEMEAWQMSAKLGLEKVMGEALQMVCDT